MYRKLALLATVVIFAQIGQSANAQGQRRGFGPPRGIMLLENKSVQSELKLSDEQVSKITTLLTEIQAKHRDEREALRDLEPQERMKRSQEIFAAMETEAKKPLSEILDADQAKRFKQLDFQVRDWMALLDPTMQTELKITDSQKGQLTDLNKSVGEKRREIFQSSQGDQEGMREK